MSTQKELWVKEWTEFEMSNGTFVDGYRVSFVRLLEEGETFETIDESEEIMELHGGTSFVTYTDSNMDELDVDDVVNDIPSMEYEFYIE